MAKQFGNVLTNELITLIEVVEYDEGNPPIEHDNVFMFIGKSETDSNGVATFYLTNDGTSSGDPLFNSIGVIVATAELNTGTLSNIPLSSIKQVSSGKVLEVNVVESASVLLGGEGLEIDGENTPVNLIVVGNKESESTSFTNTNVTTINKLQKEINDLKSKIK